MENNMKKYFILAISAIAFIASGCDSQKNPNQRTYENSFSSSSTVTNTVEEEAYLDNSLSTGEKAYEQPSVEDDPFYDNSLSTGASPYSSTNTAGDDSEICITTSSSSNCDVVVIIKKGNAIARNAYIQAGDSYTFNLANGTYQVFFYGGKGWNPGKAMPGGKRGGFVANESYSKDSPVSLENQILEYELIPQPNGNFSTQQSSAGEMF